MTNSAYLDSLLRDKEELFKSIAVMTASGEKQHALKAIDDYMILDNYCRHIETFIATGILNGDAEKEP